MSHTPTPWTWINAHSQKDRLGHLFGDGEMILDTPDFIYGKPEDAAFIVKACNNHEKLLEALEKIVSQTNDIRPPFRCIGPAQMVEIAREAIKVAAE